MNTDEMIDDHRKMLMVSGNLSEFQIVQLKGWPYLVFDNVDKVEIEYDFLKKKSKVLTLDDIVDEDDKEEDVHAGTITYNVFLSNEIIVTEDNLNNIAQWTKFLFWLDTEVIFKLKVGGKKWKTLKK